MQRLRPLILGGLVLQACIDLPSQPSGRTRDADASTLDPFHFDAGARRPIDAPPYTGPECDAASAHAAGDRTSAAMVGPDGGFLPGIGGNSPAASSGPGDPGQLGVTPRRPKVAGELVITEIMSDPAASADTDGEWFELHNPSADQSLDIGGCVLSDGGAGEKLIPAPLVIAPGAYAVIVRSAAAGLGSSLIISFSLTNAADTIAVRCDGIDIDRVAYGPGFPLLSGASMSLDPQLNDALSNDYAPAWCLATLAYGADLGTPGKPNPDCDAVAAEDAGAD